MIKPVSSGGIEVAPNDLLVGPNAAINARDRSLLEHATTLALQSAYRYGIDLPVGAVAAAGNTIVGGYFASDRRTNYPQMHAEYMAIQTWRMSQIRNEAPPPDSVVVSIEPCRQCQDFLATIPSIRRVGFGLSREDAADRGIVKPHPENIFRRALRIGLPYEVVQIEDPRLKIAGLALLDNVRRNPSTEEVEVDHVGLGKALSRLDS